MVKINLLQIVNNINLIDNNIYIYICVCVCVRARAPARVERERERVNVQETVWKDSHITNVSYQPIKE